MPVDNRVPVASFGRKYDGLIPDRDQWLSPENLLTRYQHIFYTDESKTSDGSGSGWYLDEDTKYFYATGKMATVFLTEVYAILNVAYWLIEKKWRGNSIGICSDSRKDLRVLVGVIIGHNVCSQHMATMGVVDSPICLCCFEDDDTTEHFLCSCSVFSRIRLRILGCDILSIDKVYTFPLPYLLRFINESKSFVEE